MRIDAIRNCRMAISAPKTSSSHSLPKKNETQLSGLNQDTVSFQKGNATKGAATGTVFGLFAITALSALSGLALSPLACGLYAAAFGTAGGIAGKALDDAESKHEIAA